MLIATDDSTQTTRGDCEWWRIVTKTRQGKGEIALYSLGSWFLGSD